MLDLLVRAALDQLSQAKTEEASLSAQARRGVVEYILRETESLPPGSELIVDGIAAYAVTLFLFCSIRDDLRAFASFNCFEKLVAAGYLLLSLGRKTLTIYEHLARSALLLASLEGLASDSQGLASDEETAALASCSMHVLERTGTPLTEQEVFALTQEMKRQLGLVKN